MKIELTKVSSKGQVVIPQNIRDKMNLEEGETLAVSMQDNLIVLKKMEDPMEKQDLDTLEKIREAWRDIAEGKFRKMKSEDFLKEIETW